jgi:hypothetical protein
LKSVYLSAPPTAEDGIILWSFGFEFVACLEEQLQDGLERQRDRLERYAWFRHAGRRCEATHAG